MFEKKKTKKTIALNILYVPYNTEEISQEYKSKYNKEHKNPVTLLVITDGKEWHYLAVKKISIIYRNNIKTEGRFLLFKFLSFV